MHSIINIMKRGAADSIAVYILEALLPFTKANINLVFKPSRFFYELEQISKRKKRTLQNEFYKLKKRGLITFEDGTPRLTEKGYASLGLYKPAKLEGACLMVVFDIPECDRDKRRKLRLLLKELKFHQVQKSVWVSRYETRKYLRAEIRELNLQEHVKVFEAYELTF